MPVVSIPSSMQDSALLVIPLHSRGFHEFFSFSHCLSDLFLGSSNSADVIHVPLNWIWRGDSAVCVFSPSESFVDTPMEDDDTPWASLEDSSPSLYWFCQPSRRLHQESRVFVDVLFDIDEFTYFSFKNSSASNERVLVAACSFIFR